ncbi:MAG: phosphoribosyltransferase [Candidatus Methylarchaceae archaeon HK01M]|nr:phosphoribosyltransferase [Candidatus Methylarchaceae archaeon HK01M]
MEIGKKKFIMPSINDIDEMLSKLAKIIKENNFEPDILIGVSRGGLIPVAILSDKLGVESKIVGVKYYCGVKETKEKPEITQKISYDLNGKKVLIVDDVADMGHSLQLVRDYIRKKGAKETRVCTIHYKPWSVVKPEYFLEETKAWVIYPWEVKETVTNLFKKFIEKGLKESEALAEIEKDGVPKEVIEELLD